MKIKTYKKQNILSLLLISIFFFSPFLIAPVADTQNNTDITVNLKEERGLGFVTDIFGAQKKVSLDPEKGGDLLRTTLNTIIKIIFSVAGIILVIMLSVYGTQMIYAQMRGSVGDMVVKKSHIIDIMIGAGLLLLSYLILNFINPQLLSPSLLGFKNNLGAELGYRHLPSLSVNTCSYNEGTLSGTLENEFVLHPETGKRVEIQGKGITVFYRNSAGDIGKKTLTSSGGSFSHSDAVRDLNLDRQKDVVVVPSVSIDGTDYAGTYKRCGKGGCALDDPCECGVGQYRRGPLGSTIITVWEDGNGVRKKRAFGGGFDLPYTREVEICPTQGE